MIWNWFLFTAEHLRLLMLNHTCDRENCVCCELSFLFHMMDISPGKAFLSATTS